MHLGPEYLLKKEYFKGSIASHYKDLVDQPFGYAFDGVHFYNGLALSIVDNHEVIVQERKEDEQNQPTGPLFVSNDGGISYEATGQEMPPFKLVEVTIDGQIFLSSYIKGYKAGLKCFSDLYMPSASIVYGPEAKNYTETIHNLYKHKDLGWERLAKLFSGSLTNNAFYEYGYYAGLCYSVDLLVDKYPQLSGAIKVCKGKSPVKLTHPQIAILYHLTGRLISANNAEEIAQLYGQTSGQRLFTIFCQLDSKAARIDHGKNTITDYREIIKILTGQAKISAEKELEEAIKIKHKKS